jgi:hypothetical protein
MFRTLLAVACLVLWGCAASPPGNPETVAGTAQVTAAGTDGATAADSEQLAEPEVVVLEPDAVSFRDEPKCEKVIPTGSRVTVRRCGTYAGREIDALVQDELIREQMEMERRRQASDRPRRPSETLP